MRGIVGFFGMVMLAAMVLAIVQMIVTLAVIGMVGLIALRLTDHYIDTSRARRAIGQNRRAGGLGGRRR